APAATWVSYRGVLRPIECSVDWSGQKQCAERGYVQRPSVLRPERSGCDPRPESGRSLSPSVNRRREPMAHDGNYSPEPAVWWADEPPDPQCTPFICLSVSGRLRLRRRGGSRSLRPCLAMGPRML